MLACSTARSLAYLLADDLRGPAVLMQYEEQLARLHADIKEDARTLRISNQVICDHVTPGRLLPQDKLLSMEWQTESDAL